MSKIRKTIRLNQSNLDKINRLEEGLNKLSRNGSVMRIYPKNDIKKVSVFIEESTNQKIKDLSEIYQQSQINIIRSALELL